MDIIVLISMNVHRTNINAVSMPHVPITMLLTLVVAMVDILVMVSTAQVNASICVKKYPFTFQFRLHIQCSTSICKYMFAYNVGMPVVYCTSPIFLVQTIVNPLPAMGP